MLGGGQARERGNVNVVAVDITRDSTLYCSIRSNYSRLLL
jgi:hypothetical protein